MTKTPHNDWWKHFVVGPFGWLLDWRWVNFDLIGVLDSYHTIYFYRGGAKVVEHRGQYSAVLSRYVELL